MARSAAAIGATAVVVSRCCAPAPSGTLAKPASGALERLPLVRVVNLARALATLKDRDFWCIGLDAGAQRTITEAATGGRSVFILGSGGAGLRRL